jgi:hypothetical protein
MRATRRWPAVSPVGLGKGPGWVQRLLERDAVLADLRGLARPLHGGQGQMVLCQYLLMTFLNHDWVPMGLHVLPESDGHSGE